MNEMLLAALTYFEEERLVFPLTIGGKPLVKWGGITTPDHAQVLSWWGEEFPGAGIGVCLGRRSDLWLLDIDVPSPEKPGRADGTATLLALIDEHGALPKTSASRSPGGGFHLWWCYPEVGEIRNSTSELGPGIDVKGARGMGILPPTRVRRGAYRLLREQEAVRAPEWLERLALAPAPRASLDMPIGDQLVPHRLGTSRYGAAALSRATSDVAASKDGTRHRTLNATAYSIGRLVGGAEIDLDEAIIDLRRAGIACGLRERDVRTTVRDGIAAGMRLPRTAPCR